MPILSANRIGGVKLELPALAIYIYDMISGMSRADVKNVLLIMHIDSVILGVVPHT